MSGIVDKEKNGRKPKKSQRAESFEKSVAVASIENERAIGEALPEGWARATLEEVTLKKVEQVKRVGPLTYIDIGAVDNEAKRIVKANELGKDDKIPSRARQLVEAGDVLVSMTRPNLNAVAKVPSDLVGAIASTGFEILRAIEVEPDWLFNAVKSREFVDAMSGIVQGALYPAVRPGDVRRYRIPVPPLAEQTRIVSAIESLQERSSRARELLAEVGPLIDQLRQSVLRDAFSGKLTADWRAENPDVEPASELLQRIRTERRERWEAAELAKYEARGKKPPKNWRDRYKEPEPVDESELPVLPEGWCWARFEKVIEELRNGLSPKPNEIPPGLPILRINSVRAMKVTLGEVRYLENHEDSLQTYGLKDGDLLFTRYNGSIDLLGVCGMVRDLDGDELLYPDKLMRVRFGHELIVPEYIELYFASPSARERVTRKAKTTSGQQGVSGGDIKGQPIALAPLEEQQAIVRKVSEMLDSVSVVEAEIASLESSLTQLDRSILAKAFRGELVPQDPNDEPASELLARIRAAREQATSRKLSKQKSKTNA